MAIPADFLQTLLARVDIVEVVGRHVQLKKAGVNHKGLCPFHGEKSPSFIVSPSRQTYHCFGCGVHGDALRFLVEYAGLGFKDAVAELASGVGLQVPEDERSAAERERDKAAKARQHTLTEVLAKAAAHYKVQLKASPKAIAYLKGRGLSGEIAARFGLGYAPEGWRGLASVFPRYDDPLLADSGLVILKDEDGADAAEARRYDRFRDRVMFPIRNVTGEVIGFGGRVLDGGEPKYLNSPETPVFHKGRELYGLFEARAALRRVGHVLVVEGYMDVVALAQLGIENAVATLGTACTAEHVQKLFRFTEQVVFSFDGDAAGRRAAGRALEAALPHASDTRSVRFLFLPPEHDPDSYVREHGAEAFQRLVEQAVPLSRQLIEQAGEGCDLGSAEGRARALAQARPMWAALPDGALKRGLLGELAALGRLEAEDLLQLWSSPASRGRGRTEAAPPADPDGEAAPTRGSWRGKRDGEGRWGEPRRGREREAEAPRGPRRAPPGPADHVLRLLLLDPSGWDHLGPEDHELLHGLPAPLGPLIAWLERELAEHGPQPWPALRAVLQGLPPDDDGQAPAFARAALRLVPEGLADLTPDPGGEAPAATESPQNLRRLVDRLWVEQLKREESETIAAAAQDPAALQRWREIHARRRSLEQGLARPLA